MPARLPPSLPQRLSGILSNALHAAAVPMVPGGCVGEHVGGRALPCAAPAQIDELCGHCLNSSLPSPPADSTADYDALDGYGERSVDGRWAGGSRRRSHAAAACLAGSPHCVPTCCPPLLPTLLQSTFDLARSSSPLELAGALQARVDALRKTAQDAAALQEEASQVAVPVCGWAAVGFPASLAHSRPAHSTHTLASPPAHPPHAAVRPAPAAAGARRCGDGAAV